MKQWKQSAMQKQMELITFRASVYTCRKVVESVAKALEYAIDDWAIAQMAKSNG